MILNCKIYVYILNNIVYACCSRFFSLGNLFIQDDTYNYKIIRIPKANKYLRLKICSLLLNIYEEKISVLTCQNKSNIFFLFMSKHFE